MLSGATVYGGTKGISRMFERGEGKVDDSKTCSSSSVLFIPIELTSSKGSDKGKATGGATLGKF